jgi:hypothetical protein
VSRWLASRRIVPLECLSEDAGRRGVGQLPARAPSRIAESDVGTERARSLGTFNILSLLASARERGLPHVYLCYYVAGCLSVEYKRKFRPNGVLRTDGMWEGSTPCDVTVAAVIWPSCYSLTDPVRSGCRPARLEQASATNAMASADAL